MSSTESSFSNSISISDSLDDFCRPTLLFFEDLSLFVPNSLFIACFFNKEKDFFSWHSRNCFLQGETVNSFAQLALDWFAWYMGAEHFGVWWGIGLTSAGLSHHWRCGKKCLMFPILKFHCQLHHYVSTEIRPIYGMRIHGLGICVSYREMVEFL